METINFGEPQVSRDGNSAPKTPRKWNKKFFWTGVGLAILVVGISAWQYWQYRQSPYYRQMQYVKELEKMAKESDKWGGKNPQETVALFANAVRKGDFELASKYGNREQIMPVLEKMKTEGKIDKLINWLKTGEIKMFVGGDDANLMFKEDTQEFWVLSMHKSEGGTWKIDEF